MKRILNLSCGREISKEEERKTAIIKKELLILGMSRLLLIEETK